MEDRQHKERQYVGGSSGVSIRIMKGVYFRSSEFRGHPVTRTRTSRDVVDVGQMAVTTKHLYFVGRSKGFRVRHSKIAAIIPLVTL